VLQLVPATCTRVCALSWVALFGIMAADKHERTGNRFWAPLAVEYGEYIPLQAGSIDGTDTVPHDHGIVRAMTAKCKPML